MVLSAAATPLDTCPCQRSSRSIHELVFTYLLQLDLLEGERRLHLLQVRTCAVVLLQQLFHATSKIG